MNLMHRALNLIYPDQCVLCTNLVDGPGALCAACWRETPFLTGHVCDMCGTSLVGRADGGSDHCDDCIQAPNPWCQGRAVFEYGGSGRRIVLALKHGDRTDLALPAATWMANVGASLISHRPLLVPVPIHWTRMVRRKFNQSALLAKSLAKISDIDDCPDALVRTRATKVQDGMSVEERFANVTGTIRVKLVRKPLLKDRDICLIDDVMTSGATLSASAQACHDAGAARVSILVLARVTKSF